MRVRQDPEFCPEKAEFWLEPEFWVNLSFAPNAQKKAWVIPFSFCSTNDQLSGGLRVEVLCKRIFRESFAVLNLSLSRKICMQKMRKNGLF